MLGSLQAYQQLGSVTVATEVFDEALVGRPEGGGCGTGQGTPVPPTVGLGMAWGGGGGSMWMERSHAVASCVQLVSGLLMGKTPKPWPPVAK